MHTDSTTVDGFGVAQEPAVCVDNLDDVAAIGNALNEALAAARKGVRNPDMKKRASERFGFFLKAAKVRSWRALVSSAKHVSIARDGATVYFQPTCREGQSYAPLPPDRTITVEAPDEAQLGESLLEAFERCE